MGSRASSTSSAQQDDGKGITTPRLFTPPLRPLNRRTSRGYEVADFAAMIGEPLLPWQRWVAIHAMELLPDGEYRFRVVLVLVARQNGKSSLKRTVSLWRLYMDGAQLVLGCAQDVGLAREQWNYCLSTIRGCPDLASELDTVRNVNGDEWFRVTGGGRYKITASNEKAGRGLSVDELNIDELRTQKDWRAWSALSKTTMARARAQAWCMSNAGDDNSVVLNALRDAALAGRDPSIGLFEWSAADGCQLGDWHQTRQANPGLGYILSARAIRTALGTDTPEVYRTEVLCQRVPGLDSAIDPAAWKDCTDPAGTLDGLRDRTAACVDVALDGQHVTLAVAARTPAGPVRVEIAGAWKTTDEARAALPLLVAQIRPAAFAWYPTGPAAALAPVLRPLAARYKPRPQAQRQGEPPPWLPPTGELTGQKVGEACQGMADLTRGRQILHPADPLLDAHIAAATRLHSGDGWRFTRHNQGHCDAAYAAAGAIQTALTMPEPRRARIRIIS